LKIGKELGIGTGTVQRVLMEQPPPFGVDVVEAAFASLVKWTRPLMQKGPAVMPSLLFLLSAERLDSEVHATHAAARRHAGRRRLLLRQFGDHGFGRDQKRRD
jgi:hypothetical protein